MNDIFLIAISTSAVFLLILLVWAIRSIFSQRDVEISGLALHGASRRLRAVAAATIAEGVRMKMAAVFIVVLLIVLPLIALTAQGDGTIKGRVQMFVQYAFGLTAFLLAMLTITLSARSLAGEIAGRQVYGLLSKPIPRWQVIAGKWLGVTLLNLGLVLFALVATYAGVRYLLWSVESRLHGELMNRGGLTADQANRCLVAIKNIRGAGGKGFSSPIIPAMADALGMTSDQVIDILLTLPEPIRVELRRFDEIRRQVLVARASVRPDPPDVAKAVEDRLNELKRQNELPKRFTTDAEARAELTQSFQAAARAIPPFYRRRWQLKGLPPAKSDDFLITVRFKIEGFTYQIYLPNGMKLEDDKMLMDWCVGEPESPSAYFWPPTPDEDTPPEPQLLNKFVEFEVPTNAVKPDGTIHVEFFNGDPRRVEASIARDGLEVLYTAGTFEGNLVRAVLAVMIPLMALAAVGIFFSTFCTFPVGFMVTIVLYFVGTSATFLYDALGLSPDMYSDNPTAVEVIRKRTADVILTGLSTGHIDAGTSLIEGRLITTADLARDALTVLLIKGGLFFALSVYVFRRREMAAVIV